MESSNLSFELIPEQVYAVEIVFSDLTWYKNIKWYTCMLWLFL